MNIPLNNENYVQKQGMVCPFCGGQDLDVSSPVIQNGDSATQGVICRDCHRQWEDVYMLSGYQRCPREAPPKARDLPQKATAPDNASIPLSPVHS